MKQAKKRQSPILTRLVSSTRRANKSINSALAYVTASNRRFAKHKPKGLPADRLGQMPDVCLNSFEKLRGMVRKPAKPVTIDAMNDAIVAKVVADSCPGDIPPDVLRALIDEGRD